MTTGSLARFLLALCAISCAAPMSAQDSQKPSTVAPQANRSDTLDRAYALNEEGFQLHQAGDAASALPLIAEALRLRREALGERHTDTLASLHNYTSVLNSLGRANEAEPILVDALRIRREVLGDRHPDTLSSLNNYAFLLEDLGRFDEAEPLYAEVLRIRREVLGDRHPDTLASRMNYAGVARNLGRFIEAERLYAEALRLTREVLGERHPYTLTSLNNYAVLIRELGRTDEAVRLFGEALLLSQEVLGERHPDTLVSLSNYAGLLDSLGLFNEAERLYAQTLILRREVHGGLHPNTLTSLGDYAGVLRSLGRNDEAALLYAEAVRLSRAVLGERHPNTLTNLDNYAITLSMLGRANEAEPLYAEVLQQRREVLGERHPTTLFSIRRFADVLLDLGQEERALPLAREFAAAARMRAIELSEGGVRGTTQRDRELTNRQSIEVLLTDVLWANRGTQADHAQLQAEAFTALQLASAGSTSRAVAEAAASRFTSGLGLQALVQERQGLAREWVSIEAALIKNQAGRVDTSATRASLQDQLNQVDTRIGEIDRRLADEAPQYFAILNQQAVDLQQVRQTLGEDEAALLLVPTPYGTHIMALTRDAISWARATPNESDVEEAVARFRTGLEIQAGSANLPQFDFDQAYDLYTQLIAPVELTLQGASRVYVIADGALSRLPLGTLIASAPPEDADANYDEDLREADWLADRYALVQLPSLQSLVYIRAFGVEDPDGDGVGFTGFGAPVLRGESRLRGARSATLAPVDAARLISDLRSSSGAPLMEPTALRQLASLPGTRQELEQVRTALGVSDSALYLGAQMTEAAIRSADLSRTQILHLATHGLTSEESGALAEPGLVFTPPDAAQEEDDGYLAASEVVGLNLTAADWVILSACNTASPSGRAGETGLSGLAQAFFYAGAQSLLVSHWPVFDDIAPRLTVDVLSRSQNGQPRAEALQAAMRTIRDDPALDAAHPAVWAPFILVGEGR